MRRLLAGVLLIHAMLGCCWHHAHDCDACETSASATIEPSHAHAAHGHADHAHEAGDPCDHGHGQLPGHCRFECQGFCAFLPVKSLRVDGPFSAGPVIQAVAGPRVELALPAEEISLCGDGPPAAPPLRLHLLMSVLLI